MEEEEEVGIMEGRDGEEVGTTPGFTTTTTPATTTATAILDQFSSGKPTENFVSKLISRPDFSTQ